MYFAVLAEEVERDELPFIVNWTGPVVKDMEVNDKECLTAIVKIIEALEALQPQIPGIYVLFSIRNRAAAWCPLSTS